MNNKFIAMVILKPDIPAGQVDFILGNITTLFEQYSRVQKVWFLGKKNLDYKVKKHTEGYYLKLEITAKDKKIENIKRLLKNNQDVIFSLIIKNENSNNTLPIIKKVTNPFIKYSQINTVETNTRKVYMLISKNLKLPFSESNILAISEDEKKLYQYASKKIQECIYVKGYYTLKSFKVIKDIENELKRNRKVEFIFGNNTNVGQQLLIQEQNLI